MLLCPKITALLTTLANVARAVMWLLIVILVMLTLEAIDWLSGKEK